MKKTIKSIIGHSILLSLFLIFLPIVVVGTLLEEVMEKIDDLLLGDLKLINKAMENCNDCEQNERKIKELEEKLEALTEYLKVKIELKPNHYEVEKITK